ncbi:protein FAM205C [Sorex araneus]|uniref:protein FAM205C n=1 Tax=Sorex araneus TaxID=42254 RepID=UPI0024334051|nr:protein FAM205C [Sorex araneus]
MNCSLSYFLPEQNASRLVPLSIFTPYIRSCQTTFVKGLQPLKVQQKAKDKPPGSKVTIKPPRAKALPWKVSEKPKKLLSVIKRQGWLPQEGSVRRLLCTDPSCDICNDVALEIKQLLSIEHTSTSKTSLASSKGSSGPEFGSASNLSLEKNADSSLAKGVPSPHKTTTVSQVAAKNSIPRSIAQSPYTGNIKDLWVGHHHPWTGIQVPDVCRDKAAQSSSISEKPAIPVNKKDEKKTNTKRVQEKKEGAETGTGNKMEDSPHPKINPDVKSPQCKDSFLIAKNEPTTKIATKTSEKDLVLTKQRREAKLEKTAEAESLIFFDAPQCPQRELQ